MAIGVGASIFVLYFVGMCKQDVGSDVFRIFSRATQVRLRVFSIFFMLTMFSWFTASTFGADHSTPTESYRIVHIYPHDSSAFTQGLVYVDGMLYEGTGLNGRSSIRMVDLNTGRELQQHDLPAKYFGEGLTDWKNDLIELTWRSHTGFVYDRFSFRLLKTFAYPWEGWGLTHDSQYLILSDGTAVLHFLDPGTFRQVRQITVTDQGKPVLNLNELEYIHGEIYANVWMKNKIARISPATGNVLAWIDLSGLRPASTRWNGNAVLNGIAYDHKNNRLFITGKLWPKLFEIKLMSQGAYSK